MKTLSTAASLRADRSGATPIYLLQIEFTAPSSKTIYLSDRYVVAFSREYLPFVHDWGTLEEALNTTDTDGRPATATIGLINTQPIEGKARLSDLIRTPSNTSGTYEFAFAKVTITQLFEGLTTGDEIQLGVFYIEDPTDIGEASLTLRLSDQSLIIEDAMAATTIAIADFPTVAKSQVDQVIPHPFGTIRNVRAIPVVDMPVDQLNMPSTSGLDLTTTTITLLDASRFITAGAVQIDAEVIVYTGKSGNNLTGCSRAQGGTAAAYHNDRTQVLGVTYGTNCYRFVVGESVAGFPIKSITNIRQNDAPTTVPSVQLDATDVVTGKHFAMISYTIAADLTSLARFHAPPPPSIMPVPTDVPGGPDTTIDSIGNNTWNFQYGVSIPAPPFAYRVSGVVHRHVTVTWQVLGGSFAVSGSNSIRRFDPVTNAWVTLQFDNAGPGLDFANATYDYDTGNSIASELWEVNLSGDANSFHFAFTITSYVLSGSIEWIGLPSRSGNSTAQIVIGELTCDVEGTQDDSSGSVSGTASLLLENPVDVTKFVLMKLYGVASGDLGSTWSATRTALASAAYKWARMLGAAKFSQLRRSLGEQARSQLYLEAGRWEYQFLADAPTAQKTLDYTRDIWEQVPATVTRSSRTDVRNVLNVSAEMDYTTDSFRYVKTVQDVTTKPQKYDLALEWIQDHATADAVAAYWLAQWKRQRFIVELVSWWNALAVEKIDYLAIDQHPILSAHGGVALGFRVVEKSYLVGDDNPGRMRLRLIEV